MTDFAPIGFHLPAGLTHKEYARCDRTAAVVLVQRGGINIAE